MTLPLSPNPISTDQIRTELGLSAGTAIIIPDSVRVLAGKPTGSITLPNDLWGKSSFLWEFTRVNGNYGAGWASADGSVLINFTNGYMNVGYNAYFPVKTTAYTGLDIGTITNTVPIASSDIEFKVVYISGKTMNFYQLSGYNSSGVSISTVANVVYNNWYSVSDLAVAMRLGVNAYSGEGAYVAELHIRHKIKGNIQIYRLEISGE